VSQTAVILQWLIAAALAVGGIVYGVLTSSAWRVPVKAERPQRDLAGAMFEGKLAALDVPCESAAALADRTHDTYRGYLESVQSLESKATALLSFVGGGVGLISLAAGTDKVPKLPLSPLVGVAVAALLAMLCAALQVVKPRRRRTVDVEVIADPEILTTKNGKAVLDALVMREYVEAVRVMIPIVRTKARWLQFAHVYFVLGIAAVTVNAVIPFSKTTMPSGQRMTVHCDFKGSQFDCAAKPLEDH
jgi:hypothetical protein